MNTHIENHAAWPTEYWHLLDDGRVQCDLCPRFCKLKQGQSGLCFIRQNVNDKLVLTSYCRSSGFCLDPIEKKPLNHFYPGSSVLSFGTAGCNLACKFCQNWDISKSREVDKLGQTATPIELASIAKQKNCKSIAFTYNDPVIFFEYAEDVALACREQDVKTVAVTAGYICEKPRERFFKNIDAANVDLKSFNESFYYKLTGAHLQPVLETLCYIKQETNVWLELTTLLIPEQNDSSEEIELMTEWVVENLGPDVPMHFTAFHPDWKMQDTPRTPFETLERARTIAIKNGVRYAYTGNAHDKASQSTYCYSCESLLIGRDWYQLDEWNISPSSQCLNCGTDVGGHFDAQPGGWGRHRLPIYLGE